VHRYQTIYAAEQGSVAAPTAGLHFTEAVFNELEARNIEKAFVTLHVGAGTFRPVKAEVMSGHEMHSEYIEVDRSFLERLQKQSGPVYAVGTTSLRTLESLYWMGRKVIQNPGLEAEDLMVSQWEPYEAFTGEETDPKKAIAQLLGWMDSRQKDILITKTQVMIAPGYRFRMVKGLVTNFHQPQSTLLLLVAAMIGDQWKNMYAHALAEGFRFLSYGDGCLIETA
jgi:S-adenosylmethionine:tRNA ribosyltransferase-isomerase